MSDKRPLTGPVCSCGGKPRRRRRWRKWDRVRCPKCGSQFEVIPHGGYGELAFLQTPPTTFKKPQ